MYIKNFTQGHISPIHCPINNVIVVHTIPAAYTHSDESRPMVVNTLSSSFSGNKSNVWSPKNIVIGKAYRMKAFMRKTRIGEKQKVPLTERLVS